MTLVIWSQGVLSIAKNAKMQSCLGNVIPEATELYLLWPL